MATTYYAFGIDGHDEHNRKATGKYECRAAFGDVPSLVELHREWGHDVFRHEGATVGRDSYPVAPSPELTAALDRAGWVRSYCATAAEKAEAARLGVPHS